MITTDSSADPVAISKKERKLVSVTEEEKRLDINMQIKVEEIKDDVKGLKFVISNMKNICSLV